MTRRRLACSDACLPESGPRPATAVLDVASAVGTKASLLRGPERMFYGLVEFEICDPDGYRICVSGEVPPGAQVRARREDE